MEWLMVKPCPISSCLHHLSWLIPNPVVMPWLELRARGQCCPQSLQLLSSAPLGSIPDCPEHPEWICAHTGSAG